MVVLPHTPGSTSDGQGRKAVTAYFHVSSYCLLALQSRVVYTVCSVHHSSHPDLLTFSFALKYSQLDIFIIPIYFASLLQLCNARFSRFNYVGYSNVNTDCCYYNANTDCCYDNVNTNRCYDNVNTVCCYDNVNTDCCYDNVNTDCYYDNKNTDCFYDNVNIDCCYNNANTAIAQYSYSTF